MVEPAAKRQKINPEFGTRVISNELASALENTDSGMKLTSLTLREAYDVLDKAWDISSDYEMYFKAHTLNWQVDDRYAIEMMLLMLCGIQNSRNVNTLLEQVFRGRNCLVGPFLDVYETGVFVDVDIQYIVSGSHDMLLKAYPGVFVRLVKRGDIIVTPKLLASAIQVSTDIGRTQCEFRPVSALNLAGEILSCASDDGYTVQVWEADQLRYSDSAEVSIQTDGNPLTKILDSIIMFTRSHPECMNRAIQVRDAYTSTLDRVLRYRECFAEEVHAALNAELLPNLRTLVISYVV